MRDTRRFLFGDVPNGALGGFVVNYYESDFGSTHLVGRPLFVALGAHKRLKRRTERGRECYRNCGPCVAERGLLAFLEVVYVAGGTVKSIREDW